MDMLTLEAGMGSMEMETGRMLSEVRLESIVRKENWQYEFEPVRKGS